MKDGRVRWALLCAIAAAGCSSAEQAPNRGAGAPTAIAPPSSPGPSAKRTARPQLTAFELQVVAETNVVRADPRRYAEKTLALQKRRYDGRLLRLPRQVPIMTREGAAAVADAIRTLRLARAAPPLAVSAGMSRAARQHVDDIGPKGRISHSGSDGSDPFKRIERHGSWQGSAGENIHYGGPTARQVVIQLLVDDGVPSRGHRANILNPKFRVTGVACGKHKTMRQVCVVTYAEGYVER